MKEGSVVSNLWKSVAKTVPALLQGWTQERFIMKEETRLWGKHVCSVIIFHFNALGIMFIIVWLHLYQLLKQ